MCGPAEHHPGRRARREACAARRPHARAARDARSLAAVERPRRGRSRRPQRRGAARRDSGRPRAGASRARTGPRRRDRRARRALGPVARVELAASAVEDLRTLIQTHSLPADTTARVVRSLRPLERFPLLGPELGGRWKGFRFMLGPWRWMVLVYVALESEDRVVVVTVQDARSSTAVTASRA